MEGRQAKATLAGRVDAIDPCAPAHFFAPLGRDGARVRLFELFDFDTMYPVATRLDRPGRRCGLLVAGAARVAGRPVLRARDHGDRCGRWHGPWRTNLAQLVQYVRAEGKVGTRHSLPGWSRVICRDLRQSDRPGIASGTEIRGRERQVTSVGSAVPSKRIRKHLMVIRQFTSLDAPCKVPLH